ncbi:MAG TPA: BatA domain-containing protein [Brevundimonas sp.]|nr:BatA domain-containing protein [Brevundimonas sp.]
MSPALLLPVGLAALAAVLIPLIIHIARRTESRTIDFAALRWLEAKPKPRQRPRIDERWLVALRLLLLAAIALWLARPVLWGVEDDRRVVAVTPGVSAASIASVAGGDARRVWLSPGFPAIGGSTPAAPANPISLIRHLDAELPPSTPLTILVPAILDGADAQRPILSRRVTWQVAAQTTAEPPPLRRPTPTLTLRHSPTATDAIRYFRAAAAAWAEPGAAPRFQAAAADTPIERDTTTLVWLAPGRLPAPVVDWIRDGGAALLSAEVQLPVEGSPGVVWRDPVGQPLALAEPLGRGRVIRLTRPLEPASIPALLEPDFPDTLLALLAPPPAPARVAAVDHAPLAGIASYDLPPFDLRPWLALLIALIFGAERWMATRHTRAAAP